MPSELVNVDGFPIPRFFFSVTLMVTTLLFTSSTQSANDCALVCQHKKRRLKITAILFIVICVKYNKFLVNLYISGCFRLISV
jgi:hypothetical protein